MMKRIIVSTDFSQNAYNALSYARLLLQDEEVTFTLLHIYESPSVNLLQKSSQQVGAIYQSSNLASEEPLQKLLVKINGLHENRKHTYNVKAHGGALDEAIKKVPTETYDLIVMGSKGATGLKSVL